MSKVDRIDSLLQSLESARPDLPTTYTGYFALFNAGDYYTAHDVLEHQWLRCRDDNCLFYKGLIQLAGGFVHMRLNRLHPFHRIHGKRLAPARRLLALAVDNILPYPAIHLHLNTRITIALCQNYIELLPVSKSSDTPNPWVMEERPTLSLRGPTGD